jgi:pimeloyl-ACP methyl ester carboxylesterase
MRRFGLWLGRGVLVLAVLLALVWGFGPREQLDRAVAFDAAGIPADVEPWLAQRETTFADVNPEARKEIVWAGAPGVKAPLASVYLHGFSATKEEIRPVPDEVAKALGANLYLTRLAGHGRTGAAMAEATPEDWLYDAAEAMEIGRRLGERVIVIGTSTGATLAAVAATDPALAKDVAGIVLISPNFALNSPAAAILDLPFARIWGPWVAGAERSFTPVNADHGRFWTTRYPTVALFPMATLMRAARAQDWGAVSLPALFIFSPQDKVIDPAWVRKVAGAWGGPREVREVTMGEGDDPYGHVLAGRILSPGKTEETVTAIVAWAEGL